ncbi:S8 family serine peptidase [Anaerobaca lacustris]|uniref:S8 family serine peptidase n=1 Tax=Anaerobaca lacustris TaxID=3044600 RepID=A0AAW6TXG9_9BACT|nr:S8 family serine peptidase [Sedimentisphaerales bacterium M17dextr]
MRSYTRQTHPHCRTRQTIRKRRHCGPSRLVFLAMLPALAAAWGALDARPARAERLTVPSTAQAHAAYTAQLAADSEAQKAEAIEWALRQGAPIRCDNGQRVCELMALTDDRPLYYVTANLNAAISLQTDRVRDMLPWDLDGAGLAVGVWDAAGARQTHQEFQGLNGQSRIRIGNSFGTSAHSTHVAGTVGATGVVASATGMAPAVGVESYNWNNDTGTMSLRAARTPGQANAIYVSNHSYGILAGWEYHATSALSGHVGWHWWGGSMGPGFQENWFGRYSSVAATWDQLAHYHAYYLAFAAAGNDRADTPAVGDTVYYRAGGGWHEIVYSEQTCPAGDGEAKGGYDTISFAAVAKNIMTVGAVHKAVSQGVRSLAHAAMADFSSWGPTDDGRIKPDIVANGVAVYSTTDSSDDAYDAYSGTSMASPNAAGSAALLIQHYGRLFPGQFMRSSTLKGLILHTADDLGRPGPDYAYGWGLMNTKTAVETITRHAEDPRGDIILEGLFDWRGPNEHRRYFVAEAGEPIRVTLCWTDPPGASTTSPDDPTPRLVHDLDLRVIGPDGSTVYYPHILNPSEPAAPATTGDNNRDNVEQVCVLTPGEPGLYEVRVSHKGALRYDEQYYSLISDQPLFQGRPPKAEDVATFASPAQPATITLAADDDGHPNPPGALTYVLASLPKHGTLETADGNVIGQLMALPNHSNKVVYRAQAAFTGEDEFTFYVDDGGTAPSGGRSNIATAAIAVRNLVTVQYQVSASNDDAFGGEGYQLASGRHLWVGQYTVGMRFENIGIPRGSMIFAAHLQVYCGGRAKVRGAIHAEATGDAVDFGMNHPEIWERPRTEASVRWDWKGNEPTYHWYTSPDAAKVIQEVIDRPDFTSGNAIAVLYVGLESSGNGTYFHSWDQDPGEAPKLEIVFAPPAGGSPASSAASQTGQAPPTAQNMTLYASSGQPLTIQLDARDDGRPMPMRYTIASLPKHGTLSQGGAAIAEPATLAGSAGQVVYTPEAGFAGDDRFTFYADDGGSRPRGGTSNTATVTVLVREMVARRFQVAAPADDAFGAAGNPVVFSETLSIGKYGSALRFRNIDIPPDSEIVSARLLLCMDTAVISRAIEGRVTAEAVADARDFTGSNRRISALPTTVASVRWTWQPSNAWECGVFYPSPDIGPVIQEIVDRPDWMQGNALAILYLPAADYGQSVTFFACDDAHADRAARLEVIYAPPPDAEPLAPSSVGSPPVAHDMEVETPQNTAATIALRASDDGLPEQPGLLTYEIISLPERGTLEYPDGTPIAAPARLRAFGDEVVYRPPAGFAGVDRFTFRASDGGAAPTGGFSEPATVTVKVTRDGVPSPLGYWSFDENAGNVVHDSIGVRHGTVVGAQWTPGRSASALEFDGANDYVSLPANGTGWLPRNDFALALWVRFRQSNPPSVEMLLDLDYARDIIGVLTTRIKEPAGYALIRQSSQKIAFHMTGVDRSLDDLETTLSFSDGAWVHIVAVRNGSTQEIYVNGQLDGRRDCSSSPIFFGGAYNDANVSVGRYTTREGTDAFGRDDYLRATVDEVMIFDQALFPEEVRRLYEKGGALWP